MFAALDESTPELPNGIAYVMTGVVLLADDEGARRAARAVLSAERTKPFHWHREGPVARNAMIECLGELGAVAHVVVHSPTRRRQQEAARARALSLLVPELVAEGAGHLCIESRGTAGDLKDRIVVLDALNPIGGSSAMTYDWRTKDEPLLWLPDAVCGAVADLLLRAAGKMHYYARLQAAGVLSHPTHIGGSQP